MHLAYLAEACRIHGWTRDQSADHMHAHFATNPAEIAMLVRILGGVAYSFTAHGSDIVDRPAQIGLASTVDRASFVVAVCSFGRSQILKWIPHSLWHKVHVVHCGLPPGYGRGATPITSDDLRLVCIGRLSREKGQLLLVNAARLLADRGVQFEIVLAGDGPMRMEIEQAVQNSGLARQIRITGWLDAAGVQKEIENSTAVVVSSLSEGLPVVIMEAMANSRPVIAPYIGGIPELITPGRTGWLFPAGDTIALADAMQACLQTDEARLREMGRSAMAAVWANHDVDVEAGRLINLFSNGTR
jgi:glycosyltransferase involved in cell wall biosynthesis